jgi:hypothetical protein
MATDGSNANAIAESNDTPANQRRHVDGDTTTKASLDKDELMSA